MESPLSYDWYANDRLKIAIINFKKSLHDFVHRKTSMKILSVRYLNMSNCLICSNLSCSYQKKNITTPDDREVLAELTKNVMKRKAQLYEIEQSLPQKNSLYLKVTKFFVLLGRIELMKANFRSFSEMWMSVYLIAMTKYVTKTIMKNSN